MIQSNKPKEIIDNNSNNETCFERAIFFSWGCTVGNCKFCYMSSQPDDKKLNETRRGFASILAEAILCKKFNWDIGFFTGGIGVLEKKEMVFLLKTIANIVGYKPWLSVGALSKEQLEYFKPYIYGVVGSTETINPVIHKKVCPSKPIEPYEQMFENAIDLGIKRAMTIILGMGESEDDIPLLIDFISRYKIDKIHIYGFIPHKGTEMENIPRPSKEYQAKWISSIRKAYPEINIQCGIWHDRLDYIPLLLKAGSNSISKLKATKYFGTDIAKEIEEQCKSAGKEFRGTLTKLPEIDAEKEVDNIGLDNDLKKEVKEKLNNYIKRMKKNINA